MSDELSGKVALVTGASKNIGKGIALEVGASGAVTYLTTRSVEDVPGQLASLQRTAAEIEARGGKAIAVACDHTDDAQVEAVFDRIRDEQGRLDLVVNVASPTSPRWSGCRSGTSRSGTSPRASRSARDRTT